MRVGYLAAVRHGCPGCVVTSDAEVRLFRYIKCVQVGIVVDRISAGIFHVYRGAGAITHKQRTVKVAH
ncbi:hypothetical protein D1872_336130 [compost metagenome]